MKAIFRFSNYKNNTVLVASVFIAAFVIARLFRILRFSDYREAFYLCVVSLFCISFLGSFINAVYILRVVNFKEYKKYYWLLFNCIPLLFLTWLFITIIAL